MKTIFTKFSALFVLMLCYAFAAAQTALPYKNGFENATENAAWQMVSDSRNPANNWVVGNAAGTFRSGNALYISSNLVSKPATYNDTAATTVFASREFILPVGGTYSIFFDLKNYTPQNTDSLFVCWVDNSVNIQLNADGSLPDWVHQTNKLSEILQYGQANAWKTSSFSVCGTGNPEKLVFVWKKNSIHSANTAVAAIISIDNIQINQNTPINYFSGFDTPEQRAGWTFVNKEQCVNKWNIGSAVSITHPNALYISNDNGNSNAYTGTSSGYVSAYKEITLPAGEQFNIDFDWKSTGDDNDFMYVCWNEDTTWTKNPINLTNNSAAMPSAATLKAQLLNGRTNIKVNKSLNWEHGKFTVTGMGRPVKLIFFWANNSSGTYQSPAAIDNVNITKTNSTCATPVITNVNINNSTATVTWTGSATSYQLIYRNTYESEGRSVVVDNAVSPYIVTGLSKGHYTFMVRGICENSYNFCGDLINDTSAFATTHAKLLLSGDGCIDYWKLTGNPNLLAQYGDYNNPSSITGIVDDGQDAETSRHTLITAPSFDPRTDGLLSTIPDGSLATVRLGNWQIGAEAERLTYTFTVDPEYAILLMKYAVVLEDPGHTPPETTQPKFTLEILNAQNENVDADCGNANFVAGSTTNDETWHSVGSGYNLTLWKEWTTVGLNLQERAGQTLKVRLTTYDCSQSGHYGYAYFTLDCKKGELKGLSCGSEEVKPIEAPEGFNYCWYLASDRYQTCINTTRTFVPAPTDTNTYICKVMQKNNPGCFFNLPARLSPRYAEAHQDWQWVPEHCENYIKLVNNSVIKYGDNASDEPVEYSTWTLSNASGVVSVINEVSPKVRVPDEGADYNVELISRIANGESCGADTINFRVVVPKVAPIQQKTTANVCDGETYRWLANGQNYTQTTNDTIFHVNGAGCDSLEILNLFVGAKYAPELFDTICRGESRSWEGQTLTETGIYEARYPTSVGCDSVITMNFFVHNTMNIAQSAPIGTICAIDDNQFSINYSNNAAPTKYAMTFDKGFSADAGVTSGGSIIVPLPINIRPDKYNVEIEFINENIGDEYFCKKEKISIPFEVSYSQHIIEQNWNDVIALLNNNYNDPQNSSGTGNGYTFTSYKWYKNGKLIDDETKSYIYIPSGLEMGAQYNLLLTRTGEDYEVFTCPITAQPFTEQQAQPTITSPSGILPMYAADNGTVDIWNVQGILISTQKITSGESQIIAPAISGIYILDIKLNNGIRKNIKIVVN
ncbi:MAG: T9SS type A sorting domain-containing protein [Prevotellaceae bacterium]|jgi:hypothetical protein|nr:T9SS type A sorting domain-containing protein [Prevotellaceae bacterium]